MNGTSSAAEETLLSQSARFQIRLTESLVAWLDQHGLNQTGALLVALATAAFGVLILAYLANRLARLLIYRVVLPLTRGTRTQWDDLLVEKGVFQRLSHLVPAIVIYYCAPLFLNLGDWVARVAMVYLALAVFFVLDALLNALVAIYATLEFARQRPIRGYVQAVKVFFFVVTGIIAVSMLLDQSPWKLLSGLGALTAILILVFRDSLLGLVASIQIAVNDMVRIGDWIEMPKYNADGDVIEITLQTVKVRNWDKTISTIPTYALVSESFRNWRGMFESGGRRIKRAVYIDMTSIRFCTPEMIERFKRFAFLRDYVEQKEREIEEWNRQHGFDTSIPVNGRRMTNIGTFRAYLVEYLRRHPKVRQDMTLLVRQLPPTEHGLPIEIYVFSADTAWVNYESIQADIFDHILAVVPEFGLRVFQYPTGLDLITGLRGQSPIGEDGRFLPGVSS